MTRTERQNLGIKKWISAGFRGTLVWATGVGKTRAAMTAIKLFLSKNKGKKVVVIVPTEHLKIQWMQEAAKAGVFHDINVEIINSAIKINSKVDFLILDECHRIPADSFFDVFKQRNPSIVLGLSATFHRLDGRHELLAKFCPICDVITVKEAIENKWLSPYKEYKVLVEVDDITIYNEANKQFYEAFSMFDFNFNEAMKCLTDIIHRRVYGKKMGLSAGEMDAIVFTWHRSLKARKEFVMNHPKKVEIARKILNARRSRKAITFSATIKQAEKIGIGVVVHSGKTKKKNRMTVAEFARLSSGVMNTAKSLDEGADIPGLNLGIILCNTSSGNQKTQRIGRIIRYEEGKEAELFTLVLKGTNEEAWYSTSTAGKNYIEITEEELEDILNLKSVDVIEREAKEENLLFRM